MNRFVNRCASFTTSTVASCQLGCIYAGAFYAHCIRLKVFLLPETQQLTAINVNETETLLLAFLKSCRVIETIRTAKRRGSERVRFHKHVFVRFHSTFLRFHNCCVREKSA